MKKVFIKYNPYKLETEIIEDSYIHSSTSKNRKLNSNKN